MKIWIACAGALVLASACGSSKDATAAMAAMQLADGKSGIVHYASKSGSGDKMTFKDVVINGPGAAAGDGLKARTMTLAGLKMTRDGKPWFSDMTLSGITPEKDQPGLTASLATITVKHANETTGAFLASAFTKEGPGAPPPFDQWGLDKLSFNGLKVNGDLAKMGQGKGTFNVFLDEASISDLEKTVVGASHLSGFKGDFDIPPELTGGYPVVGKFDFGTGDMKGLRAGLFADAIKAGAAAGTGGDAAATRSAETSIFAKMTSPIDPGYDALTWSGLNIQASGVTLTTTKVDQKATRDANGVVTAFTSPRASIALAANAADGQLGAQVSTALAAIGYQKVELYAESDATYDPSSETARVRKYDFGMTDGFDLQVTGGFQGVLKALTSVMSSLTAMETQALAPATPDAPKPAEPDMSGLEQLKVVDFDLTLTDKSLVNHLLGLGGGDPEALRTDIVNQIKSMGADFTKAGVDKAVSVELTAAVAAFVRQPGVLSIKLKPAQPVALAAKGAKLDKAALGFSATATPGPATPAPATPAPAPAKPN
jgi:hypothetical protein